MKTSLNYKKKLKILELHFKIKIPKSTCSIPKLKTWNKKFIDSKTFLLMEIKINLSFKNYYNKLKKA